MSLSYSTFVTQLANEIVVDPVQAEFQVVLPNIIDYAEQRLYRELDLLNTVVRDTSSNLTVGTRTFTLPQSIGRFVVTSAINVITPSSAGSADAGTRNQLVPTSQQALDLLWPNTTGATVPSLYAMITDQVLIVGPAPDSAYPVEVVGTIRPTPLSVSNPTTYLTLYLPDLFFAAAMISASAYQRNFGAQADNPQQAQSWETQYGKLFASAGVEEQRKRYASGAWGSLSPTPIATPSR